MAALTTLVLGTESPEAQLSAVDFARWLEHGDARVIRFDPEAAYRRGGMPGLERDLLRKVAEEQVGILLYPIGMEFDFRPAFLAEALPAVYKVLLVADDEHYFEVSYRYYAQAFDYVVNISPLVDHYRMYGIDAGYILGGFSSRIFHPVPGTPKDIAVSFVGAMHGKAGRQEYAAVLARSRLPFQAYGAGTASGVVSQERVIDIFRRTRINLNFTGGALRTPLDAHLAINRRVRQVKGRCQMVALCGSFVLSEYAPGLEKFFDIGSEIDVFNDADELVEKIRFYLANEEKREQMARRAHERALRDYDEPVVGRRLAEDLQRHAAAPRRAARPLQVDRRFWGAFGAWRFKYLVIFLFSLSPILFLRELWLLVRTGHFRPYAAMWFAVAGLLVAARSSSLAAWLAQTTRRARRSLRGQAIPHG